MAGGRLNRRNIISMSVNFSFVPQITDRNSEQFLEDIIKLHESQYTPINHIPTIFGRKINLLTLYNAVAKRGGFKKMNTELTWEGVLSDLKVPIKCGNASFALRNIFQRYLEPFERIQREKSTIKDIEDELQMASENPYKNMARKATLTHSNFYPISMVYRGDSQKIGSHARRDAGLSCDLPDVVEFFKLEMSLKSGLSNEIDFSLNAILLMSFQKEGVQLSRNYRLLGLILSSVGVGNQETLQDLSQQDQRTRRFLQFWNHSVSVEQGRHFLLPDIFISDRCHIPRMKEVHQVLSLDDELTIYDKEGQRVQLVGTIIRNLALDPANSHPITQSHQCMRFIFLCSYATHYALRQVGLEILSMLTFPVVGILSDTLDYFLCDLLKSEDRVERLVGIQLLIHLSDLKMCGNNTNFICSLPKHLFSSLISMLIIHDLHIVALALEAVYALSEMDPSLCIKLVECSCHTLSTLYLLLNLEAQVMGSQSLIRIRVMQGPTMLNSCSEDAVSQTQSNHRESATSLMPPPPVPSHKIPATTVLISHPSSTNPQIHSGPEAPAVQNKLSITENLANSIMADVTSSSHPSFINAVSTISDYIPPPSSSSPILTNHTSDNQFPLLATQQVYDNSSSINGPTETISKCDFVKGWLLDNYIESPHSSASLFVMYKHLQVAVHKFFRDLDIVTAEELHKLVRLLFPQVQLIQLQTNDGLIKVHYYNLMRSAKDSSVDATLKPHSVLSSSNVTSNVGKDAQLDSLNSSFEQRPSKRCVQAENDCLAMDVDEGSICPPKRARPYTNHDTHLPTTNTIPCSKVDTFHNNHSNGLIDSRTSSHVQGHQLTNGSLIDAETKTFSSSTVSPIQCESLVNGTDGSSEETIEENIRSSPFSSNHHFDNPPNCVMKAAASTNSVERYSGKRNIKRTNFNQLGRTRTRFRTNNPCSKGKPRSSSSQRPHNLSHLYICQWDNCLQSFDKPQKVYGHVYTNHFMTLRTEVESKCFWSDCKDTTRRTPLPLLNHVNEQHCNNVALESARQVRLSKEKENSAPNTLQLNISDEESEYVSRLLHFCTPPCNIGPVPATSISTSRPESTKPSPVIGQSVSETSAPSLCSPDPSIVSVNLGMFLPQTPTFTLDVPAQERTASSSIPPDITNPSWSVSTSVTPITKPTNKEGPVTKHIRYLSALILRNLCKYSFQARRFVAVRHRQIFEMSISGLESSTALSECLFYSSTDVAGNIL